MAYSVGHNAGTSKSRADFHADRESGAGRSLVADARPPRVNLAGNRPVPRLSHDIRTQLYIIIGFAELMLDEVPGKINDEQRRSLNDVLNSGKRLLELLHDIVKPSGSR
jgi:signal transduction histidine kinase